MNDITALERALTGARFTLARTNKHPVWHCPCGHHLMITSRTRHGGRGDQNARALISRILRKCQSCGKCQEERKAA